MEKKNIDFICSLHGYMIRVKEIHWNTESNATHLLCDEIEDTIHDCEDRFAEIIMGLSGEKFKIGDLIPMVPDTEELIPMLKEMNDEVKDFKKELSEDEDGPVTNILDDLLEAINKYRYRATQK